MSLHVFTLLSLLAITPTILSEPLLFIPGNAGSMRENQFDRYRKGFNLQNNDHADQFDSNSNVASYDRANAIGAASQSVNIGAGGSPFGAAAGSSGSNSKSLITDFDRGALITSNSRLVDQNGRQTSSALDTGIVQGTVASDALIGGPVAGAGSSYHNLLQGREQATSDADHIDQHLEEDSLISEQFDRGASKKDAAKFASVGERFSPFGAALGTGGSEAAEFEESRERGINSAKKSVLADRNANNLNEAYNKQTTAKVAANDAILVGPAGASAGRSVAAQHLESKQGALQHGDSEESRVINSANMRALDNHWASGSQQQEVGIADAAPGGEVSNGQQASRLVNGYDRLAEAGVANSAARKAASSTLKTFDDREVDQAYKSNALVGGF